MIFRIPAFALSAGSFVLVACISFSVTRLFDRKIKYQRTVQIHFALRDGAVILKLSSTNSKQKNAYLKYICYLSKLIMQQHTDIPFAVFIHQIFPLHIIIALNSHEQLTMNLHTVSIAVAQPSAFVTPIYDAPWSK